MPKDRTGYAPWSLTREAGVQSATVDGTIQVPQYLQPVIDTGFVDEKGNWKGRKSSDEDFFISDPALAVANSAVVLLPSTADRDFIDMTGFTNLFIAIKPSNAGNYNFTAVMGPDSRRFGNLSPVDAAVTLQGNTPQATTSDLEPLFSSGNENCNADVWTIFSITHNLQNQKNMQFKVQNNSGGNSDIDFAFLRVV